VADPRRLADALARFVFEGAAARGVLVSLDACCRDILACHPYPPALRRVMAELLAAAALLASTLKFRGSLIVQLQGNGPVRMLVVECDSTLALRATAQWRSEADALDAEADLATLAGGPANARLAITLDPKDGGPLYQGVVGLEGASVARLIEHYLTTSEQIDSRLVIGTSANGARGLLLQRMPGAGPADPAAWERIAAGAGTLSADELERAVDATDLLTAHFAEHDVRLFEPRPVRFACGCSEERIARALRLLGRAEVESILAEQGMVGLTCEFCNRRYTFVASAARALFDRDGAGGGAAPATPATPAGRAAG
jgi:molecular chaperone Hsp33